MTSKLYFGMNTAGAIAPAVAAPWDGSIAVNREMLLFKNALETLQSVGPHTFNIHSPALAIAYYQGISPPLSGGGSIGPLGGTFYGFVAGSDNVGGASLTRGTVRIYITSGDGLTFRGFLWQHAAPGYAFETNWNTTTLRSRSMSQATGNPHAFNNSSTVTWFDGDRVVVEVGAASDAGNGAEDVSLQFGAPSGVGDFSADAQLGGVGWIQFDINFPFIAPPVPPDTRVPTPPTGVDLLDHKRWQRGWGSDGFCAWGASDDAPKAVPGKNHAVAARNRLIAQYRDDPGMLGLIQVLAKPVQSIEDAGQEALQFYGLEGALDGLNAVAAFLGVDRVGYEDNTLRIRLAGAAQANASTGSPDDVRTVLQQMMQGLHSVRLYEDFPAATRLLTYELQQADGRDFAAILARSVPAGTRVILEFEVPTWQGASVGWVDDNTAASWAEWGADPASAGFWAEASDGG